MDPDKRSVTIEVMGGDETVRGGGRFATDHTGYRALLHYAKQWPGRVWAIEGCRGIGHHVAVRLLSEGEEVVDVPPKLSARTRVCATGQGRKTGTTDANSLGWVGTRMAGFARWWPTGSSRCCGSWSTHAARWARTSAAVR
jgi:transposase